jgi:drug/metabolite transporter (DMT)-like permease
MNLKKAVAFMLFACALSAPMFAFIKQAISFAGTMPTLFVHFVFAALFTGLFAVKVPKAQWKVQKKKLFGLRVLLGLITTIGIFVATKEMPIVHVSLLLNTAPLFVPLISFFYLKERPSLFLIASICLGFFGVFLFLQPVGGISVFGASLGLIGAGAAASSMVLTRELVKSNHPLVLAFYFFLAGAAVIAFSSLNNLDAVSLKLISYGLTSGFLFALELYFFTKAFKFASASWLGPFNYAGVLVSAFVSYITVGHTPSLIGWIGILLVTLGGSLTFLIPTLQNRVSKLLKLEK